ncbi:hypothetical protein [Streptomyces sp. NBRC 109706]|uniref:hypothetical protein n=1 Tax=Streptomyces sp. NBRC 109706 TaxID=1550035 RepID=UPI00078171A6|nr:hypothetical protein [Streptomyces sp. NBRC 109706]
MPHRGNEPEFVDQLRWAGEDLVAGPAPVDEMIQQGRALRARRRRVAVAGAASAAVLAAGLAAGLAWPRTDPGADPVPPAAQSSTPPLPGPDDRDPVLEVRPYERVVINEAQVLGLLPEGEQNYVLSSPAHFDENMEQARGYPGANIRPGSVSVGFQAEDDDVWMIDGAWRLAETPARIVVVPDGGDESYPATLVRLAGETDWGVFYLDTGHHPDFPTDFRVIAYATGGEILAEAAVSSFY